ncbi:MAG: hypothetical protein K8S20_05105 [Chloroflexi bacterium]|nr:hypothetical protein [Chloroflexota bacterium]
MNTATTNQEMLAKAQSLLADKEFEDWEAPFNLDENRRKLRNEVLEIWDWAETQERIDLQSVLAKDATSRLLELYRGKNMEKWKHKLLKLQSQAKVDDRQGDYCGFLEALLPIEYNMQRRWAWTHELHEINRQRGIWPKEIWYAGYVADHLKESNNVEGAKKILLHIYQLSSEKNFPKGVAWAFHWLAELAIKKDPALACRLLYQAKLITIETRWIFGIPINEKLNEIRALHSISGSAYELTEPPSNVFRDFVSIFGE